MVHRRGESGTPQAHHLARARCRQAAQNVVEYGVLIATIALVVLFGTLAFGQQVTPWFAQLAGHVTTTGT
jgi:Flp pilus assembly pilin Flp